MTNSTGLKLIGVSFLICHLAYSRISAQEARYRYQDATQLWRLSGNAAGLGMDNSDSRPQG